MLYFAYGSNLHPRRMQERAPSTQLIGHATLPDHALCFHKKGQDGSAKCNAFLTNEVTDRVEGVLYRIDRCDKEKLDHFEGLGRGYEEEEVRIFVGSEMLEAWTYLAHPDFIDPALQPFAWYKALVIAGARYHGFPKVYLEAINSVPAIEDPDKDRAAEHLRLLQP